MHYEDYVKRFTKNHFREPPLVFPRNDHRNSILMTRHCPDLGIASDWMRLDLGNDASLLWNFCARFSDLGCLPFIKKIRNFGWESSVGKNGTCRLPFA